MRSKVQADTFDGSAVGDNDVYFLARKLLRRCITEKIRLLQFIYFKIFCGGCTILACKFRPKRSQLFESLISKGSVTCVVEFECFRYRPFSRGTDGGKSAGGWSHNPEDS